MSSSCNVSTFEGGVLLNERPCSETIRKLILSTVCRRRATSSVGTAARALAATKRASYSHTRPRSPSLDGLPSDVSSVSSHSSDEEPDSDDPDRESSKYSRWKEKARKAQSKKEQGNQRAGTSAGVSNRDENSEMDEIRRKRAEAAEKRLQQDKTITIEGTDTEEEREYQARKQKQRAQEKGTSNVEKGKGKEVVARKKVVKKKTQDEAKGRCLGVSPEQEELVKLEAQLSDMPPALRNKYLKEAADKLKIAPPRASTSRRRSASSSSPAPEPQPRPQLFNRSQSESSDEDLVHPDEIGTDKTREARRRRTQGNKKRTSSGFSVQTGASGSGSAATFTTGGGGHDDDSIFQPRKHSKQRRQPSRSPSPPRPARRRADPTVPQVVDPRVDLAKRKARELSDPPTDAYSSSNGESDDDDGKKRKKGGGKRKKGDDDLLDDIEKMEREMNRRKRIYREERRPGYSNPRKN